MIPDTKRIKLIAYHALNLQYFAKIDSSLGNLFVMVTLPLVTSASVLKTNYNSLDCTSVVMYMVYY